MELATLRVDYLTRYLIESFLKNLESGEYPYLPGFMKQKVQFKIAPLLSAWFIPLVLFRVKDGPSCLSREMKHYYYSRRIKLCVITEKALTLIYFEATALTFIIHNTFII